MNQKSTFAVGVCLLALAGIARAEPALTIYNQNFAVVRDTVPLKLQAGLNRVEASDITTGLEPDSVVLRAPSGPQNWQVLEQFFRADPISQPYLLWLNEGKTVNFRVRRGDTFDVVSGKVLRSGYIPPMSGATNQNGMYYTSDGSYISTGGTQPLIEVNGQLQFSLPGEPIFPALPENAILKPTLNWLIRSEAATTQNAELAYVTRGFNWEADYNLVAENIGPNDAIGGETLNMAGLVTVYNTSGRTFENAQLKLMAGDVSKVQAPTANSTYFSAGARIENWSRPPAVSEKTFDEYHLYSLNNRTTLRDRETKQVEFLSSNKVKAVSSYVYDGLNTEQLRNYSSGYQNIRSEESLGTQSNAKVWVLREFENTAENGLGMALPRGRARFYRRDTDGQLEFVGENIIGHTPKGETLRLYTGNAFDLLGGRKRTAFKNDYEKRTLTESFEITLRNRKSVGVEIRVREHAFRGENWMITQKTNAVVKLDADTFEFRVQVPADGQKTLTYTVQYTWG